MLCEKRRPGRVRQAQRPRHPHLPRGGRTHSEFLQKMEQQHRRILVVSQHYWPENFRITDICAGLCGRRRVRWMYCAACPTIQKASGLRGTVIPAPGASSHAGVQIFRAGEIRRSAATPPLRIFLNYISFPVTALFNLPRLHGRKYDAVFCYETSPVLMMLPAVVYAKLHRVPLTTYVLDLWPENLYSVMPVRNKRAARRGRGRFPLVLPPQRTPLWP